MLPGRALRPVGDLRAQTAEITAGDLGRRLDVPPADDALGRLARTLNDLLARLDDSAGQQRGFVADAHTSCQSAEQPAHPARGGGPASGLGGLELPRSGQACLAAADEGPGIPVADRSRFTRLDSARARDTGGGGLGLAIVHDLAVAHHGRIRIEDNDPGGTSWSASLPRTRDRGAGRPDSGGFRRNVRGRRNVTVSSQCPPSYNQRAPLPVYLAGKLERAARRRADEDGRPPWGTYADGVPSHWGSPRW
ncbi:ATP-binding protein [Streptomyces sp. NPDC092129]|uniref:HAMP domain-containing protein n=1 Tax=Streptomyces sp. NPDC092129 TaxID=3366010 RepID=UPI0037FAA29B